MTPERAGQLLDAVRDVRALVVGDFMVDRYVSGSVNRVSPEAPVPVVRVEAEWSAIGGAGNVAANITALGAGCTVAGCIGSDGAGTTLRSALEDRAIKADGLVEADDRPTTLKTRVMARHQQIVRFDHEVDTDVRSDTALRLRAIIDGLLPHADVIVLADYDKGVLVPGVIRWALDAASAAGVPSVVDPKRRRFFDYGGATVFKPNAKELEDAIGGFIQPKDEEWMEETRSRLGCHHLLLTLGERGVVLKSQDEPLHTVPTVARSVYDVSGAGDTVTALVATVLAAGGTAIEAAVLANHAAAVGVGKTGVATVSADEVLDHVAHSGH